MQKKCRRCGDTFTVKTHEDYCPECLPKYSKVPKKKVPKKKEVDVTLENMAAKREEVDVTLANMIAKTLEEPEVKVVEEDVINHPSHYTRGKIEVIDFIEDQQLPYHLGNVIKYIARAGYKGDKLEDLKKARWYLDRYINEVMQHERL